MTWKNVMSPINWNIEKNTALNSKDLNLPFYLAFPDDIYLLTINNTNRNTLWEICPNLTRKTPDQMCKGSFYKCAHFLLFWIFSDLLIYHFHCYSLLFLSLYLRLHLDPCIVTLISNILRISTQILHIPTLIPHSLIPIPFPAFCPCYPHFTHAIAQFSILVFTERLLSLQSLRIYLRRVDDLVKKWAFSFVTTA